MLLRPTPGAAAGLAVVTAVAALTAAAIMPLIGHARAGASVIDAFQSANESLGQKNVELARRLLADAGIPIVAEDVGGAQGRKLVFQTGDGTAWVRKI